LGSFQRINNEFEGLFGITDGEEEGVDRHTESFSKSFGWIYNCKMVSEFENISMNQAWELPVYQFLNDLNYLKIKRELDNEQERKLLAKYKR
jgi:hypothetical protein